MIVRCPKPEKRAAKPRKRIPRKARVRRKRRFITNEQGQMVKRLTVRELRANLDAAFSRYVKDRDGAVCITCGRAITAARDWQAGHFIGRARMATRWDPKNVHSQCGWPCNGPKRGAPREYAFAIVERYGADELRRLMRLKRVKKKFTRPELEELIAALGRGGAEFEMTYAERHVL